MKLLKFKKKTFQNVYCKCTQISAQLLIRFATNLTNFQSSQANFSTENPVFVTAASAGSYYDLLGLVTNLQDRNLTLIVFDLGLKPHQWRVLNRACGVEMRKFPFHKYPSHVKNLDELRWRVLILAVSNILELCDKIRD